MRGCILISLFAFLQVGPLAFRAPQEPASTQAKVRKSTPETKWTENDRRELLAKAELGDAGSQMWLASAYEQGWFGETNIPEALKWYRKSAAKGNPDAQAELGQMYEDGEGVGQNYAEAAKWYRKAAEHVPNLGGAGQGRNNLGLLHMEGRGVPKDYVQACMWFMIALRDSPARADLAASRKAGCARPPRHAR